MEEVAKTNEEIQAEFEAKQVEEYGSQEEPTLPSEENKEDKLLAGNFKNVEELRKGIDNLGSDLPDYVLNGMNEEALEKYYTELRKDFSSKPKEEPEDKPEEDLPEEKPDSRIGDDLWDELSLEYAENKGISEEMYKKLNDVGIPDNIIDGYLDGLKAKETEFINRAYEVAGGKEEYDSIKAWAEQKYTQEELDMIASGTEQEVLLKFKAIKAEYKEENGNSRFYGSSNSNGSVNGYVSQDEWLIDRSSPQYNKDAKFKAKVDAKFRNSHFA